MMSILIAAFREGADIHTSTAMRVFGIEKTEDVTPNDRRNAKAVNFGIVYGISDYGLLITSAFHVKWLKQYNWNVILNAIQALKITWSAWCVMPKTKVMSKTLFHRRRELPDINSRNFNIRQFAERTAINSPTKVVQLIFSKLPWSTLTKP